MAIRPPPPEAEFVFNPPSAWISPAPAIAPAASMRMLPPAPAELDPSPLAKIFPSSCTAPALIRATPPPERHGRQVSLDADPAPPGVFGSRGDPYVGAT